MSAIILTDIEKEEILSNCTSPMQRELATSRFEMPINPITCIYSYGKARSKYPTQIFLYYVGNVDSRWLSKIYKLPTIAQRPGTRDECIADHFRSRYKFLTYKSWDELIKDEIASDTDQKFIDLLLSQKPKFIL